MYSYEKPIYVNAITPVIITCSVHGDFKQTPHHHQRGGGCPKCAGRGKDTKQFIEESKQIHGDRYSYEKTVYVDCKTPVIITCPVHGDYKQNPSSHTSGRNCFMCSGDTKKTTQQFIQEAKQIHGDRYSYEKTIYRGRAFKVIITCGVHGDFEQMPGGHLGGKNCIKCTGYNKKTTQEFIQAAKQIHGDKYSYEKTVYSSNNKKVVIITCPVHGDFKQKPNAHLNGSGCPKCMGIGKDTKQFIEEAKKIHGDKYSYEKTIYSDCKTKVIITCPKHGDFKQIPISHVSGHGCMECYREKQRINMNKEA